MNTDEHKLYGVGNNNNNGVKKAPPKNWLHSDDKMQEGVVYNVLYVGRIGINESMKSLNFDTRTQVARESIRRVADSAKLIALPRRNRRQNEEQLNQILSNTCNTDFTNLSVALHINIQYLKVTLTDTDEILFQHTMQNISFACGGDADIQDFVAYVAKDDQNGRACYVFQCLGGQANSVITTIGQAFELRFKNFLNSNMPNLNTNNNHNNHNNNNVNLNNNNIVNRNTPMSTPTKVNNFSKPKTDIPADNFESSINGSLASTSTQIKPASTLTNNNNNNKIELSGKKFHPNSENIIEPGLVGPSEKANKTSVLSSNGNRLKIDEKLEKMKWFHGLLTREMAEKLLVKDGDYLVRETNKADRQYVLSGRYRGECRHIFLVDPSGVVRTKDKIFENICHLIQYHQDNNIPIISKENELLLVHPIFKTSY